MAKSILHSATLLGVIAWLGASLMPALAAPKKSSTPKKTVVKKVQTPTPPPPPLAPGELPLAARAALCLDMKTGAVLYEKNADVMEYPASATKILTALLVIEAGDLDKVVTVELGDTKVEPSALEIKPGETYPRKQLLYALLLKSANDVAMALARDHSGSVTAFTEKMTQRASELGAKESHFTNPHGLHNPHHFTTARDLAQIARVAMQNPLFREIVATPETMMAKGTEMVKLRNHNRLLAMMPGCNGVKTGYTVPAQQVLVSSAIMEGQEVLSVVLHTNKPGIWEDSKLLLKDGLTKLGVTVPGYVPPSPPAPAAPVADGTPAPALNVVPPGPLPAPPAKGVPAAPPAAPNPLNPPTFNPAPSDVFPNAPKPAPAAPAPVGVSSVVKPGATSTLVPAK